MIGAKRGPLNGGSMLVGPTLWIDRTPIYAPASGSPRAAVSRHRNRSKAHKSKANRLEGAHGPTHHPRLMHAWQKACGWAMRPLLKMNEKLSVAYLRHKDGYRDLYVPTRLGPIHMLTTVGTGPLPPIVVIHGLTASAADYGPMLHRLARVCQSVIAVDMLGHGRSADFNAISDASFVAAHAEALDQVIPTRAIVLGHSLGGYVAARYGASRPHKVAGLVLAVPPGGPASQAKRQETVMLLGETSWHDSWYTVIRAFPRGWPVWPVLTWVTQARLMRQSLRTLIQSDISQCFLPPTLLQTLKPPVLLFWGDRERVIPAEHFEYFRNNLPPSAKVVTVKRMGHSALAMMPKRVMLPFLDWVAQLPV